MVRQRDGIFHPLGRGRGPAGCLALPGLNHMKRICAFCGSSPGAIPDYLQAARSVGQALAQRSIILVYGGARVGMMGQVAAACSEAGGDVIGVIPRQLVEMELADMQLANLQVVESMHDRKARMAELADGFIAMPGGLGTFCYNGVVRMTLFAATLTHLSPFSVWWCASYLGSPSAGK